MRKILPFIAAIPLIAATPALAEEPDHLTFNDIVWTQVSEINYKKPHKGAFAGIIVDAAEVPKKWRPFSACVLKRESGGNLKNTNSGEGARNPRSSASGRWQFLNTSWQESLPYMVAGRLKDHGMPGSHAKSVRVHLEGKPIHKWDGLWQDIGHNAVIAAGGWSHWSGSTCNSKRP